MNAPTLPVENVMDRLSDWIGSFVPGCFRLPPRHPLKVSVVMGLLGLLSGWCTMATAAALSVLLKTRPFDEEPTFLIGGVMLGIVAISPWTCWLGMRRRWQIPMIVYCAAAHYTSFAVVEPFRGGNDLLQLFLFGLLLALSMAVIGLAVQRRIRWVWLAVTALISGGGLCSWLLIRDQRPLLNMLPQEVMLPLIVGWFFSLLHTPLALCLGYLLWDTTPLPKFSSEELPEG